MKNNTLQQILSCILLYVLIGTVHFFAYKFKFPEQGLSLLVSLYLGHLLFAAFVLGILLYYFEKTSHYLSFLYLMTTALKFGLFYLLVWPVFMEDGSVEIHEKTSFLLPYFSVLLMETYILISKLNKI